MRCCQTGPRWSPYERSCRCDLTERTPALAPPDCVPKPPRRRFPNLVLNDTRLRGIDKQVAIRASQDGIHSWKVVQMSAPGDTTPISTPVTSSYPVMSPGAPVIRYCVVFRCYLPPAG